MRAYRNGCGRIEMELVERKIVEDERDSVLLDLVKLKSEDSALRYGF